MLAKIKKTIQKIKINTLIKRYDQEVFYQKNPYKQWIKASEGKGQDFPLPEAPVEIKRICGTACGLSYEIIPMGEFVRNRLSPADRIFSKDKKNILIFAESKGNLSKDAILSFCETFKNHVDASIIYGDEDYLSVFGRVAPWFKPDFSPDTLMSFNYFGSMFAVRTKEVEEFLQPVSEDYEISIYDFLLKATNRNFAAIRHITKILFHKWLLEEDLASFLEEEEEELEVHGLEKKLTIDTMIPGTQEKFMEIKVAACKQRKVEAVLVKDQYGYHQVVYRTLDKPLISIIIPSKDNWEILKICIGSIRDKSSYKNVEIIVIDNGSTGYNRAIITELSSTYDFVYLYEPMEFNFSKMCNLGVSESKGEYILLLNDDIEVIQEDFLERMVGQASLPHVGAVGAKLLYPNNQGIQHVGVTNLEIGPAHKLGSYCDDVSYYYGHNRLTYDMIAVTAACLMVKKDKYLGVNGLEESLKVAYNDVDFCFRLYEQGFYNVQRNDVVLYHHESFSRGNDEMMKEKWDRLLMEKEKLYSYHEDLRKQDPFYNKNLIGNSTAYGCNYIYPFEDKGSNLVHETEEGIVSEDWINKCLHIQIDYAIREKKIDPREESNRYLVEGWSYIQGMDNVRYDIELVLKNNESLKIYTCPTLKRVRMDAVAILPGEINTELAGFVARIKKDSLPVGTYTIGLLAKDKCSRQRLLDWTDDLLQVQE